MKRRIEIIKGITDDWMKSEFNPPASDSQIEEFEKNSKITLPTSYADWLMFSNGSILRGNVAEIYGV